MKINIAVLFGCRSVEHEVSIISAVQAMRSVDRSKYSVTPIYAAKTGEMYTGEALFEIERFSDIKKLLSECERVCLLRENGAVIMRYLDSGIFHRKKDVKIDLGFPVVHGTNCEDGTVAGYFEFLGLPYISCDIASAAIGMNKAVFKDVLKSAGLPVLDCVCFRAREYAAQKSEITAKIEKEIGYPLIIKPVNLGSSVGISKVESAEELDSAIALAFSFADCILAEHAVTAIREINCAVLGDADECEASVCEEPFMHDAILSYEDKYKGGSKSGAGSKGMASLSRKIPAELSEEKAQEIRSLACDIFKAIGASGVARIDFILDKETDKVYANEINTIPGSLAFYLWEAAGLSYLALIDRLVEIAFRRERIREQLNFTIDTDILAGATFGSKGTKGAKMQ